MKYKSEFIYSNLYRMQSTQVQFCPNYECSAYEN